ncbi:MAG: hypothetical protein JRE18_01240, partial [Deltaproteobacteria bacterium]|nr:hypothetical protein [Deltaproteobacteria bacterium]
MRRPLLDHGHLHAQLRRPDRADISARAGTDDDEIIGHCNSVSSFMRWPPSRSIGPDGGIVYRVGKAALQALRYRSRPHLHVIGFDNPRQVIVRTTVKIGRRRDRLEYRRQLLRHRNPVQDEGQLLDRMPRERMSNGDGQ